MIGEYDETTGFRTAPAVVALVAAPHPAGRGPTTVRSAQPNFEQFKHRKTRDKAVVSLTAKPATKIAESFASEGGLAGAIPHKSLSATSDRCEARICRC